MKHLFFLIAIFAVLPAGAKKIQLGLNVGGNYYHSADPAFALRVMTDSGMIQWGAGIETGFRSSEFSVQHYNWQGQEVTYKDKAKQFYVAPNISANFRQFMKRGYTYLGATIGYAFVNVTDYYGDNKQGAYSYYKEIRKEYNVKDGVFAGAQFGFVRDITHTIGINGEAGFRFAGLRGNTFNYVLLMAGIRYRI